MKKLWFLFAAFVACAGFVNAFDERLAWTSVFQDAGFGDYAGHYCNDQNAFPELCNILNTYYYSGSTYGMLYDTPYESITSNPATFQNYDNFLAHVTVPEDLKLVSPDGSVVGDEVCVGDRFGLQAGVPKGEFWIEGGDIDSPPVYWVADVEEFSKGLVRDALKRCGEGMEAYTVKERKPVFNYDQYTMSFVPANNALNNLLEYLPSIGRSDAADELSGSEFSQDTLSEAAIYADYCLFAQAPVIDVIKNGEKIALIQGRRESDSCTLYLKLADGSEIPFATSVTGLDYSVAPADGYVDKSTGIPVYEAYTPSDPGGGYNTVFGTMGTVVCGLKDKGVNAPGLSYESGYYTALNQGTVDYNNKIDLECAYYLYSAPDYNLLYSLIYKDLINNVTGYATVDYLLRAPCVPYKEGRDPFGPGGFWTNNFTWVVGELGLSKTIHIVSPANPNAEVSVTSADNIKYGESNILRVLLKNIGDVNISIKSIHSKPEGKLISCDSDSLAPGQQVECLLSVTPVQSQGLSVQVSYDYKSCGRSQTGLVTKTLIDSKIVRPVLKEQSYLMGVHGQCDNSYFSCYSASEGGLFAGYKCFKTSNGFYAPATERFNLRFDLSDIPKNAEILGAKLYLKASEVGGKQTVNVYSVNKIPEVVKCLPGGDICTKPYCGECKPLYDLGGTVAASAEISSAGQYSFDVTNSIKEKLAGNGIVSLQVRGAEGIWESLGQTSCSIENDWNKRDVSFVAGGRDGPYLGLSYK